MAISYEFISAQKAKLEEKKAKLKLEISRLFEEDPFVEESKDPVGRNLDEDVTEAQEQTGHMEVTQKIDELKALLAQVEKALQRIADNTYGFDENTGEPIDTARLQVYPEATTVS